ncbi:histone-lysine N-methyltransferase SETDB1-B-like isoform X2 [Stegodyphus dumicola]|uniref:histone-lysine N-methyltransferase SETDB1-B-like isoform X2 n=1 Tax=Stegodyphus dumicola TaxID=202533 RepID=UPI0015A94C06|nr:histone-lysine N-methyltransferase SETDB1-B-like isoform X2 [Stegodyphus dumicola]
MVKLQVGQITKTELYSHWRETIVEEVDASMIKMRFLETDRTEWLYRGSTRLKLLYNELANAELSRLSKKNRRHNIIPRRHQDGYVEYTNENETNDDIVTIDSEDEEDFVQSRFPRRKTGGSQYMTEETKPIRNTARKSTCQLANAQNAKNKDKSIGSFPRDVKSHLGHKDRIRFDSYTRIKYVPHNCNIGCREEENPDKYRGRNPLLIPMYLGWERQLRNYRKGGPKVMIMYRAPCGRHLRNLLEIQYYLYLVKSRLTIDLFSVDAELEICTYFVAKQILYSNDDITEGKENVPVPCVNCLTDEAPPYVEYSAERFSGRGVFLNLDKNFLAGCSCTDNCQNSAKCECQQMTNEAKTGIKIGDAGYKFRRLTEPIITGIYECNEMCKCGPQCGNRVVQHGLKVRLQMFKTQFKGWGIRCLDDIDAGMFICVYAGQLSTEQGADEDGFHFGDEYLAELDHIEVVERTKEGYESDVTDIEIEISPKPKLKEEESDYNQSSASRSRYKKKRSPGPSPSLDDEFDNNETDTKELPDISTSFDSYPIVPRPLSPHSAAIVESTEIQRKPKLGDDDDSGPKNVARKSVSMKHPMTPLMPTPKVRKFKSVRSYYGEESVYIMDAKCKGNIGRYLNHSCSPNVFVQNVFYDTYDLRFPTVAFFAQHYITAGTELTWDYNYEVGSVSGKVMRCHCDARTCRGRLL